MLFLEYPKCSTCKKAKKFLNQKNINYDNRDFIKNKLTEKELEKIIKKSNKDINKFFNTSGMKYRELELKNKMCNMSFEEKLKILSTDGMLVKRPLLVFDDDVLIGFKEKEWENVLK